MSLLTPGRAEQPEPSAPPAPTAPRVDLRGLALGVAAPLLAVVVALAVAALALLVSGSDPLTVYARMLSEGTVPSTSSPEEFLAYERAELKKWGEVVKLAGIKPE